MKFDIDKMDLDEIKIIIKAITTQMCNDHELIGGLQERVLNLELRIESKNTNDSQIAKGGFIPLGDNFPISNGGTGNIGWISVKDRMPDHNGHVVVFCEGELVKNFMMGVYVCLFAKNTDEIFIDGEIKKITHWIPLPMLPIKENE